MELRFKKAKKKKKKRKGRKRRSKVILFSYIFSTGTVCMTKLKRKLTCSNLSLYKK